MTYGFSHGYSIRSGFPHSDIGGSKLVCQLPGAYRRLRRPSSPVIAKASTTCTCSLDPITLSPRPLESKLELQVNSCLPHPESFCVLSGHNDTIFTHPDSPAFHGQ